MPFIASCLLALALGGCVTVETKGKFDDAQRSQAEQMIGPGKATVEGHAFVHVGGRTYTAGGDWVTLIPATAYAEERMRNLYGNDRFVNAWFGNRLDKPDEEYPRLTRRVKASIGGKFEFEDVRPGRWFVTAFVTWQKKDITYAYLIYDEVVVKGDEKVKVVLSGN
jgi:hypothetical protein